MPPDISDWREEYLANLRTAHSSGASSISAELIQACSDLADRVAHLQAEKAVLKSTTAPPPAKTTAAAADMVSTDESPTLAQMRLDLSEALRSNARLQGRLHAAEDELGRLRTRTAADSRTVRELSDEKHVLSRRLRDREWELRGKKKLLGDVQDEMVAMNLQINVLEKERNKARAENKQLIERWMSYKGAEADAMNLKNETNPP